MLQTTPHPLVAPLQREDSLSQDKAALDYDPLRELCEPDLLQEGRSGSSDDFCPSSGSPPGQQCHENEETLYGQQHPGMVRGMPPSLSPGQQHPGMVRGMPPSFGPGSPLHDDELPDMDEPHPADLMGSIGRSESTKKDAPMWTVQEDLLILDLVEQHGRRGRSSHVGAQAMSAQPLAAPPCTRRRRPLTARHAPAQEMVQDCVAPAGAYGKRRPQPVEPHGECAGRPREADLRDRERAERVPLPPVRAEQAWPHLPGADGGGAAD